MGWNLEAPAAFDAVREIVEAIQVIAELGIHGAIALVSARRQAIFLGPSEPLDLIVRSMPALRTRERHRLHFRLLGKEVTLVERHFLMVSDLAELSPDSSATLN